MDVSVKIPTDIEEFEVGTKYQVLSPDGTWSDNRTVSKLCLSARSDLIYLMTDRRIRIIDDIKD